MIINSDIELCFVIISCKCLLVIDLSTVIPSNDSRLDSTRRIMKFRNRHIDMKHLVRVQNIGQRMLEVKWEAERLRHVVSGKFGLWCEKVGDDYDNFFFIWLQSCFFF